MSNVNTAILTKDNSILKNIEQMEISLDVFDDYMKFVTSAIVKKYPLIIMDSVQLPFFNEPKIIDAINTLSRNSMLICILRDNDIDFLRRIHDNRRVCYVLHYPVNFTHLDMIVKALEQNNE